MNITLTKLGGINRNQLFSFFLFIFCLFPCYSQQKALKISNSETGKTLYFDEGQRVRLVTMQGDRLTGNLYFFDQERIFVEYRDIPLSEIKKIKRHPLLIILPTTIIFADLASTAAGGAILVTLLTANPAGLLLFIPAAALTYGALKPPNFLKGYKADKNWKFEIINYSG